MNSCLIPCRLLGLSFVLSVAIGSLLGNCNAQGNSNNDQDNIRNAPVSLFSAILVPGNPITSSDIAWADPGTERYYFADRSNFGVEVIDAEKGVWVGRVNGMAGPLPTGGGHRPPHGPRTQRGDGGPPLSP